MTKKKIDDGVVLYLITAASILAIGIAVAALTRMA